MRGKKRLNRKPSVPGLRLEGGAAAPVASRPPRLRHIRHDESAQPDLFSEPLPTEDTVSAPLNARTRLLPEEAPMAFVDLRRLGAPRADDHLYLMTDAPTAHSLRDDGLPIDDRKPLMFLDRVALFSLIEETAQQEVTGENALPIIMRIRKSLIETWLEADPDEMRRLGGACYLLTGNAEPS